MRGLSMAAPGMISVAFAVAHAASLAGSTASFSKSTCALQRKIFQWINVHRQGWVMTEIFEGGCFCGRIRYRQHGRPMFIHCCHCRDCQRQSGSAFAVNALIEADRVEIVEGEPVMITLPTDSGYPHDVYCCPQCQSALWSDYGRRGWLRFMRVTTLDRADEFAPDIHIFTRSRLPWVRLPENAVAVEEYYSPAKLWPQQSLDRREAARLKAGADR
ncbi:MAG: GFA family protein [Pseudorhizobium pelagicum]|uniref:GFA family protein n=1 Tax=Pseudorhizobium pelagicum TaxID=1509405 RepID=UPI00345F2565